MKEIRKLCAEALIKNERLSPLDRQTYQQIGESLGIPYTHVSSMASELRAKGLLKPRPRRHKTTPEGSNRRSSHNPIPMEHRDPEAAEILKSIEKKEIIDAEDRRKVLSLLIKASTDEVRVRAISLLESIESAADKFIGPPPPLTNEERIARVATLMTAVGREIVDAAITKAFPQETPQDAGLIAPSDSGVEGRISEPSG